MKIIKAVYSIRLGKFNCFSILSIINSVSAVLRRDMKDRVTRQLNTWNGIVEAVLRSLVCHFNSLHTKKLGLLSIVRNVHAAIHL